MNIRNAQFGLSIFKIFIFILVIATFTPQAAHAAKWYVDNALGELKPDEKALPATPKPVQLLFEFQRDGNPHAKATKLVQPWAIDSLKSTGAFTEVTSAPTTDGAVLSIKFNNVVKKEELDQAKREGFRAGLGFGLFGGVVATDHYEITLSYLPATGATPITTMVKHAVHMKFGNKDVVIPGTEVKNVNEAIQTAVRQALARGVNSIVSDPAFPK